MNRPAAIKAIKTIAALFALGALLLLFTWQTETLAPWTDNALGRGLYRLAYFARLPVSIAGMALFPLEQHHWRVELVVLSCIATPWFWYAVWHAVRVAPRIARPIRPDRVQANDKSDAPGVTRRRFLGLAGTSAGLAIPGGAGAYSILIAPQRVRVESYQFPIRDLPASLYGLRIVHLSDLHYGPFVTRRYLEYAVALVSDLAPDLVILTGDYSHKSPEAIEPGIEVLQSLRARLGIVAVLGNHDYWEGADATAAALERIHIPVLTNAHRYLTSSGLHAEHSAGQSLCIAGVDDLWEGQPSLSQALDRVPDDIPRIVLSHNPDVAEHVTEGIRVDLLCAGHTHGGQVRLPVLGTPVIPSAFGKKYAGGLCAGPHCPVLVSRGIGMAMLPIRFGVPPEVGVIELTGPA